MNVSKVVEVKVVLTLSVREAQLLRALMNGLSVGLTGTAGADAESIGSSLTGATGVNSKEIGELNDLIGALHAELGAPEAE